LIELEEGNQSVVVVVVLGNNIDKAIDELLLHHKRESKGNIVTY
jgi:hypothetical protein